MRTQSDIQDIFLNEARKTKAAVTLFLMNGFQIKGQVTAFDNFTVVVLSEGRQQMIYKHAISTVIPARPVALARQE